MKIYKYEFDNVGEFVAAAKADVVDCKEHDRSSREAHSDKWCGGVTWAGALDMVERGWSAGAERVKNLSAKITDELVPMINKTSVAYGIVGAYADVARYLDGAPDFMVDYETERGGGHKVIKIASNYCFASRWTSNEIENRGAIVLALVDALEQSGVSVELDVIGVNKAYEKDQIIFNRITLKKAGETFDIDKLAFSLTNPAFFRRLTFSQWETLPKKIRDPFGIGGGGYGTDRNTEAEWKTYIPETVADYTKALGSDSVPKADVTTATGKARAITWIKDELTKLDVVLA